MGLVDHDPVRPAGTGAQLEQRREQVVEERRTVGHRDAQQVDHDVLVGPVEQLDDFLHQRRAAGVAQHHRAIEAS